MRRKVFRTVRGIISGLLSLAMVALFFVFISREKGEFVALQQVITGASLPLIALGVGVTGLYVYFHALIYQSAVAAMREKLPAKYAIELFLKRYFVSAFIPTGFSLSQFTFSTELEAHGITPLESHLASVIYLFMGGLAYIALLLPTVVVLLLIGKLTRSEFAAGAAVVVVTVSLIAEFFRLLHGRGIVYTIFKRFLPDLPEFVTEWRDRRIRRRYLWRAFWYALLVELAGSLLLWIAFIALHLPGDFFVAVIGYVVTILVLTFSPLFQGVGLVEISLVYGLTQFGLSNAEAVTATILFRFFQLWLPFLVGMALYVRRRTKRVIATIENGFAPELAAADRPKT